MAINLGDINFGLGADTRRLQNAMDAVLQFGRSVNQAARDQSEGARAAEAALRRQEQAIISALNQTVRLNDAIRQSGAAPGLIQTTTNTFNRLTRELANGRVTALQFQRSMEDYMTSTGRVRRAVQEHTVAERQRAEAMQQATRDARAAEVAQLRQEASLFRATQAVERYNAAVQRSGAPAGQQLNLVAGPAAALGTLRGQLAQPGLGLIEQQRAVQQFSSAMLAAQLQLRNFTSQGEAVNGLTAALHRMSAAAILLAGPLSGIAARFAVVAHVAEQFNVATAGFIAGAAAAAFGFYKMGEAAITSARQVEQINLTLTAVTGSTVYAANTMRYLMDVANRSGQQFTSVAKQFSQIEAASKGTSLEGERTRAIFEAIVFSGAKLGLSASDVEGSLRAIQQIMSKGTVQAEELRGQLGDRLPGAMQAMADAMGVTTQQLDGMLKKGEVTRSALEAFAIQLATRFGVGIGERIDTITAAENRFLNALFQLNTALDTTIGFSQAYKNALNAVSNTLIDISQNIDTLAKVVAAAGGALAIMFGPAILTGIVNVGVAIWGVVAAVVGLNVAILANPIGQLAAILLRLTAIAIGAVVGFKLMDEWLGNVKTSFMNSHTQIDAYIQAQQQLASSIREPTKAMIDLVEAQQLLRADRMTQIILEIDKLKSGWSLFGSNTEKIKELSAELGELEKAAQKGGTQWEALQKILTRQTQQEDAQRQDPLKDITEKQQQAIKKVFDSIAELDQAAQRMTLPDGLRRWSELQGEIAKKTEDTRDALTSANVPLKTVTALVELYAAALQRLNNAKYADEQRKAVEGVTEQITAAQMKLEELQKTPHQVAQINAWAEIDKKVREAVKSLEMAGTNTEEVARLAGDLRDVLEQVSTVQFGQKLAMGLKEVANQIDDLNRKAQALRLPIAQQRDAEAQATMRRAIEESTDKLIKQGQSASVVAAEVFKLTIAWQGYNDAVRQATIDAASKSLEDRITDAQNRLTQMNLAPGQRRFAEQWADIEKAVRRYRDAAADAGDMSQATADRITFLDNILRQVALKEFAERTAVAVKGAMDTIRELGAQSDLMFKSPAVKEWGLVQLEITKATENFRDQLTKAEVPLKTVNMLTEQFAQNLRKVKEGEYALKTLVSVFQFIEQSFGKGLDAVMSKFIDNVFEGKAAFEDFGKTMLSVLKEIYKEFLKLALLNPLKNLLFGTNYQTLGGGAGIGGLLGSLFGGGGLTSAQASTINTTLPAGFSLARGGIMSGSGLVPLRQYRGGGIARGAQAAIFGEGDTPEAYVPVPSGRIPVELNGGGAFGPPTVNVKIENHGADVEVGRPQRAANGSFDIPIIVRKMTDQNIANGEHDRSMQRYAAQTPIVNR